MLAQITWGNTMNVKGLDKIDNQIIDLLSKDGRATHMQIAKSVGLSRTAVQNRISALEENGVIKPLYAH